MRCVVCSRRLGGCDRLLTTGRHFLLSGEVVGSALSVIVVRGGWWCVLYVPLGVDGFTGWLVVRRLGVRLL